MLDVGGLEAMLLFVVPMWAFGLLVLYWVIRLAVRHGTLDAYRIDRVDQRVATMQADVRQRETS